MMAMGDWDHMMRALGPDASLRKLSEEVAELHDAVDQVDLPDIMEEAADVMIPTVSLLTCYGWGLDDLLAAMGRKMLVNLDRRWAISDGVLHHV